MKWMLAAALLVAALPAAHAADQTDFTENTYLRVANGDIPRTEAVETPGQWNFVQYARFSGAGGSLVGHFNLPGGNVFDSADCTCGNVTVTILPSDQYEVRYPSAPSGASVMAFRSHRSLGDFAFSFDERGDHAWTASFYVGSGQSVHGSLAPSTAGLPSTSENPGYLIWSFSSTEPEWFAVGAAVAPTPSSTGPDFVMLGVLFVAGALVWAFLVSRGLVQKKSRKQVAQVAAHVEAAASEPAPVLEGKKRALLAALKEVELARQANEMPVEVYDAVKADLKKQAVTVMRALETSGKN